jgi:predicted DNA-binding protein (MmcQ/YjbR family)
MNVEEIRDYVLAMPLVTEGFPFGEEVLVFKVKNKVFLLLQLQSSPVQFNVKCKPEEALLLRENFPEAVLPGYHMNKKHWNTIVVNGQLKTRQLKDMIAESYRLVSGAKK